MLQAFVPVLNFDGGEDKTAVINGADYVKIANYHWILLNGYAVTRICNKYVSMHRMILGEPRTGQSIDHIDRDRLNNTRGNLRFATPAAQARNRSSSRRKHKQLSGFVGIQPTKSGKYTARFRGSHLGTYGTIREAAVAYNNAAKSYDAQHGICYGNYNSV